MKNKKGFTLIELLAVIVILAVIALIAVPIVLNIIEKAKEGTAKSSGVAFVKATETYLVTSAMDKDAKEEDKLKKDTEYKINNIKHLIQVKGDKPSGGEITVGSKNEVSSARMIINGYVIRYDGKKYTLVGQAENLPETYTIITFSETTVEVKTGETITLNPTLAPDDVMDGTIAWTSSDESKATVDKNGVVTGVKKGTATITAKLKNNESATITVKVVTDAPTKVASKEGETHKGIVYLDPTNLSAGCDENDVLENVNSNGTTTEIKTGCMKWYIYDDSGNAYKMILDHNTTARVNRGEAKVAMNATLTNWKVTPNFITTSEINTITGHVGFDINTDSQYNLPSGYGWLYDNLNGCVNYGCPKEDNYKNYELYSAPNDQNETYAYWTNDVRGESYTWALNYQGFLDWCSGRPALYGVRPVIAVSKSIIK